MSEARAPYLTLSVEQPIPLDLQNLCRRLLRLRRGRMYTVAVMIPEQQEQPITWAFMGEGKVENE